MADREADGEADGANDRPPRLDALLDMTSPHERPNARAITRSDLSTHAEAVLHRGGWGNPDVLLVRGDSGLVVVKDFAPRCAVVRNTWLSGQRRRRREVALPQDIPAPHRDPAGDLDDQARLQTVLMALDGLKEGERAALLLRVDHELPYEDVAAALGISPGAAKVRVHRARLHLTRILDTEGEGHELRRDA